MKITRFGIVIFLMTFINNCTTVDNNINLTIEDECLKSNDPNSFVCQLDNNPNLSESDKLHELGFAYYFGMHNIDIDCKVAEYLYNKSAELGSFKAYNGLGMLYSSGCYVDRNYEKARQFYQLAINNDIKHARANLASLYLEGGYGLEKNYEKAKSLYESSIEETPDRAYDGLSIIYLEQEDYTKAFPYTLKSAELGWANAQYNLGYIYENELGVPKDNQKALYWYEKAAEQGNGLGQRNLTRLLLQADQKDLEGLSGDYILIE